MLQAARTEMPRQITILIFESGKNQDHRDYHEPIHDQRFAPGEPISERSNTSQACRSLSDLTSYLYRTSRQRGLTLVELLVVLTIIATLAAIIYPAIIDSMKKSQAAMVADRLDAIQKAKVQYQLDAEAAVPPSPTPFPDSAPVDLSLIHI